MTSVALKARALAYGRLRRMTPRLDAFFPEFDLRPAGNLPPEAVLAWAHDPRGEAAARRTGARCLLVDDGLIRSIGPAASGAMSVSLIASEDGGLERLLQS